MHDLPTRELKIFFGGGVAAAEAVNLLSLVSPATFARDLRPPPFFLRMLTPFLLLPPPRRVPLRLVMTIPRCVTDLRTNGTW